MEVVRTMVREELGKKKGVPTVEGGTSYVAAVVVKKDVPR